jgi:hypothetical protein
MIYYLDFVYTKDGKFGMVLSFDRTRHKYEVVFNYTKNNETRDYFYKEELRPVI